MTGSLKTILMGAAASAVGLTIARIVAGDAEIEEVEQNASELMERIN